MYFTLYWRYLIPSELKTEACTNGYEGSDAKLLAQTNVPVTAKLRKQTQI
jgi:hypothetical protein